MDRRHHTRRFLSGSLLCCGWFPRTATANPLCLQNGRTPVAWLPRAKTTRRRRVAQKGKWRAHWPNPDAHRARWSCNVVAAAERQRCASTRGTPSRPRPFHRRRGRPHFRSYLLPVHGAVLGCAQRLHQALPRVCARRKLSTCSLIRGIGATCFVVVRVAPATVWVRVLASTPYTPLERQKVFCWSWDMRFHPVCGTGKNHTRGTARPSWPPS